ncbi:DUF2267 domain-containing protein [Halomicrococcus gelatinilyticus]|uniref:DUF2267 domain-containing protein n=1 Tax=Halomicrococcus gelatinilyticus TaxID=1702103 RepID=UPI002E0EDA78
MEYQAFIRAVEERTDLSTADEADDAVGATLVTLSERIPDQEAQDLASQLPTEVGSYLTIADGSTSFGFDEFVARVLERETVTEIDERDAAVEHAQAVIAVLLDAVTSRESDDVLSYLTRDYERLFEGVDPEEVWGPGWRERLGEAG